MATQTRIAAFFLGIGMCVPSIALSSMENPSGRRMRLSELSTAAGLNTTRSIIRHANPRRNAIDRPQIGQVPGGGSTQASSCPPLSGSVLRVGKRQGKIGRRIGRGDEKEIYEFHDPSKQLVLAVTAHKTMATFDAENQIDFVTEWIKTNVRTLGAVAEAGYPTIEVEGGALEVVQTADSSAQGANLYHGSWGYLMPRKIASSKSPDPAEQRRFKQYWSSRSDGTLRRVVSMMERSGDLFGELEFLIGTDGSLVIADVPSFVRNGREHHPLVYKRPIMQLVEPLVQMMEKWDLSSHVFMDILTAMDSP